MQILLPPSETKREGGFDSLDATLLFAPEALDDARYQVRTALETLCAQGTDENLATKALKLGVKNRGELARNRVLGTSGVMAAVDRYTGVLFDALDSGSFDREARIWAGSHVLVQSALFGRIRALDPIPAYRLSASTKLPALGAPLKRVWKAAHAALPKPATFTLDLRSKDYAALAPLSTGEGYALNVVQRDADGTTRALNHFNKAAKGDLVRRLSASGRGVTTLDDLLDWSRGEGLDLEFDGEALCLVTELGAPARA